MLKETDPQFVNVSLYSLAPEEHDAITQIRGSWKKTMAAIDACQQAGIHIRLATPLLKANQGAFPALKRFADAHHMHLIPRYKEEEKRIIEWNHLSFEDEELKELCNQMKL